MPSQSASGDNVPRRQFLKIAGATSVTLGLAGCASDDGDGTPTDTETPEPTTEEPPEELPEPEVVGETAETGYTCDHYGPMKVHVNDEGVAFRQSYLEEKWQQPGAMGPGYRDRTYAPARIKYPMKREGWEPGGGGDTSGRGSDDFVRISWDEAVSLVAEESERIRSEYGDDAVYAASYGWGSRGSLGNGRATQQRLHALTGGYINDSETYSTAAIRVAGPYTLGTGYPPAHNLATLKEHTDLLIWWGSDPEINSDIGGAESNQTDFLMELDEAGVDQLFINPRITQSQMVVDGEHIPINMNTDVAMMAAIGYTLLDEDLHDQEFLDEYTVGFDEFESYLLGEEDGQPKTPEWAEEITDVPARAIRNLARRMVENRTYMTHGWSLQRGDHGEQPVRMLPAIAAMVGQYGLPGGGLTQALQYGVPVDSPKGSGPAGFPVPSNPLGGERLSNSSIPCSRIADMLLNPGEEYQYDRRTWEYPDIEMIHWVGGNPWGHHQDTNKLVEAWRKPETVIVNEINWTATAEHADIVLPAVTRLEAPDIMSNGRAVIANNQPIEPLFEAKDDYEIHRMIAEEMGVGLQYTEGNSRMDWIRDFFQSTDVPMDFDEFWEEGYYLYDTDASPKVAYEDWREDPDANPMPTPSGLIEITSDRLDEANLDDCPATPKWLEPHEYLGSDKTSEYPFHLMSPHPRHRLHSEFDNVPLNRKHSKVANREPVMINEGDAEEKGIETGDVVRVWNDRAEVLAGAVVSKRIKPNHVALSYGSWAEPEEPGVIGSLGLDGNANALYADHGTSSLAQGPDAKSALVEVEKYEGDL